MSQTLTGAQIAFKQVYKTETIKSYERGESALRQLVTTAYREQGGAVVFLIVDSGNATAVTRGLNGEIPARVLNNNQITLTLTEKHDLTKVTGFNIYTSQGDTRQNMQDVSLAVINRAADDQIIEELRKGTLGPTNTSTTDAYSLFMNALTNLGSANVNITSGMLGAVVTPSFFGDLQKVSQFSSADWVNEKTFVQGRPGQSQVWMWNGVKIIVHTGLPGMGTANEYNFMFDKSAIGHAMNMETLDVMVDYNEEQDYSWTRASFYGGAKILQNSGIQVMKHDGSGAASVTIT